MGRCNEPEKDYHYYSVLARAIMGTHNCPYSERLVRTMLYYHLQLAKRYHMVSTDERCCIVNHHSDGNQRWATRCRRQTTEDRRAYLKPASCRHVTGFVRSSKEKHLVWKRHFPGHQKQKYLAGEIAHIHVISQEQVLCFRRLQDEKRTGGGIHYSGLGEEYINPCTHELHANQAETAISVCLRLNSSA